MMFKIITCSLAAFFINLACILEGNAAMINASSCSQSDVQSAIASAINGDTVNVPSGTATWSSVLAITKAITLQGAGIDQTTITLTQNCSATNYTGAINITPDTSQNTRITGFTFSCSGGCAIGVNGASSKTSKVRLDNIKDGDGEGNFIRWYGNQPGLIDHCVFPGSKAAEFIPITGNGPSDWSIADNLGSGSLLYIESNTFTCSDYSGCLVTTGYNGARYVVRYNTISDCDVDAHGKETTWLNGTRQIEVYNNVWTSMIGDKMIAMRGGTGVIYNNSIASPPASGMGIGLLANTICRGYGIGPYTDQQVAAECCCSYPCTDHVGRGQNQALAPVYIWNNTNMTEFTNCGGIYHCDHCPGGRQDPNNYIIVNRDYYTSAKPGYNPYTYPHPLTIEVQSPQNLRIVQ